MREELLVISSGCVAFDFISIIADTLECDVLQSDQGRVRVGVVVHVALRRSVRFHDFQDQPRCR